MIWAEDLIRRGMGCKHFTPPMICSDCAIELVRATRKESFREIAKWAGEEAKKPWCQDKKLQEGAAAAFLRVIGLCMEGLGLGNG